MGKGGDAQYGAKRSRSGLIQRIRSMDRMESLKGMQQDLTVLKSIWFKKASGSDHAERLESFYGPQAAAYDRFRSSFLWGRKQMLAAVAARLRHQTDLVWVDLGGGTGANVEMMLEYLPLSQFKAIYVVDLCTSLCKQARLRVQNKGWANVHVIEGDACTFAPPMQATAVTFSYSLSMIPPFHSAVDQAITYLDPVRGLMGVTDFYVSSKFDLPLRQMSWSRRFFWRSIFDMDSIDLGPERRQYLDHQLSRVWECNGQGSIPYVPYLRAPYYVWIGHVPQLATVLSENKVEAPPMFPPTFLYTQSWEDPRPDMEVLRVGKGDACLTLTSGGCNAINMCLQGATSVTAVDCNPAQSALLEMKAIAIRELPFEDVWAMFGEGRHPHIERLYETRLAPFMTQASLAFWKDRLHYFNNGLYYQGGMISNPLDLLCLFCPEPAETHLHHHVPWHWGQTTTCPVARLQGQVVWLFQILMRLIGLGGVVTRVATAPTLEDQRKAWEAAWPVRLLRSGPTWLVQALVSLVSLLCFNRFVLWFGGGVPCKQYRLIHKDGLSIAKYVARTLDGVAQNSHLRSDNYFYYNCLTGRFARDNCPSYLVEKNFNQLKAGRLDGLNIFSSTFMDALKQRQYSKVILMDHVDWMDEAYAKSLAATLAQQVVPGGKIIWRSAALTPPYASIIAAAGFKVERLQRADQVFMDRVNMYSSFYVAVRK